MCPASISSDSSPNRDGAFNSPPKLFEIRVCGPPPRLPRPGDRRLSADLPMGGCGGWGGLGIGTGHARPDQIAELGRARQQPSPRRTLTATHGRLAASRFLPGSARAARHLVHAIDQTAADRGG
jgi:hypothetical protein